MHKKAIISVVIADDHAILRAGLRMLLNAQSDIRVIAEAENGEETLKQVRVHKPDVLLLDIAMPGLSGVEVAGTVRKRFAQTRILFLTMHAEPAYLNAALAAGGSGYVLKRSLDSDLLTAIRNVHAGEMFIDSGVAKHLVEKAFGSDTMGNSSLRQSFDLLSLRERQVLKLVAEGYTNNEIAEEIFLGVKSVETYRARLLKKLRIKTRREIVQFALAAKIIDSSHESVPAQ